MGSYRKRFTPAEREQFTVGQEVEWLDVSKWKPGMVAAPIVTEDGGQQLLVIENHFRSATGRGFTRFGEETRVLPKHVRLIK